HILVMIFKRLNQLEGRFMIKSNLYKKVYKTVYIIDFSELEQDPLFNNKFQEIGEWFTNSGKRWICSSILSPDDFKSYILKNVKITDGAKIKFFKDYFPISTNSEIEF
ncbi:TPA: DUF3884 family protein, partial [Streptococcus suis]|nr:DUF3884 family protein [Streptococcus suis]HEM4480361.1 DUF3884 family protein [Streptococcus suis]HEM4656141.1 DUF3884 family protein [Streptococcus suis]